jgi:alpha-ribazole phosphatase
MRAIFVRHAPQLVLGVCAGRIDVAVEAARPAAELVLGALDKAGLRVARLVSSPTARCSELAAELALRLEITHALDPRLMELDFGSWEGRAWDEIVETDPTHFERWARDFRAEAPPGGERVAELESRVGEWLAEVSAEDPTMSCLAVTHAGVIRAARVLSGKAGWERAMEEPVPYLVPLVLGA